MRRLLVLLSFVGGVAGVGTLGITACGGNDKPPLTPDSLEPSGENAEAGAPAPSGAPVAPGTAAPKK
ncbi:MAG: hypothetical protein JWP87_4098 [Labilithrix sp.]|nr:hypothetical protein [Labilithrix sp.]